MKLLGLWRVGAASLALVASTSAVAGTGHQWGNYLWANGNPELGLTIRHRFTNDATWQSYYQYALGLWENNDRSMINLTDGGLDNSTDAVTCAPNVGEVLVCAAAYGQTGWVGIAEIQVNGNYITQATAKFNDTYYATAQYNNDGQRKFVACHEIGHTFGLGHLDTKFYNLNKGSCMDYTSNPAGPPDNRIPGVQDWNVLNSTTMYGNEVPPKGKGGGGRPGQLDPFEFRTVGSTASLPPQAVGPRYGPFGVAVGYDADGRPNEFHLDLGNGRAKRTFVDWIPGHKPVPSN